MAKQLDDGRIDFADDISVEEFELMQGWYSGQWDPLYALQSSGTLNREDISSAACNLERSIKHMTPEERDIAYCLVEKLERAAREFPMPDND